VTGAVGIQGSPVGWSDKVCVVTGAGQGLGAALGSELANRGARIVLADIDPAKAEAAARACGGVAIGGDLSREAEVHRIINEVTTELGTIDLWFSNAAYSHAADFLDVDTASWELGWHLNVMSHVWAAQALLPTMLERGEGCLVQTVSAIALTLNHYDSVYTTSKRGALAFGEYLSTTYRDRGIRVSCFCPRGMTSPRLLASIDHGNKAALNAMKTAVTPARAAQIAIDGVEQGRFLILTEADELASHRLKADDAESWLTARRAQLGAELTQSSDGGP
jgi:NAD(P)-dependent dehydrogenase (short-subunit alcohol dehydrogenase family)